MIGFVGGRRGGRRGTVAVFVAVCLVAIVGITALAVEGGLMLQNRRHLQAAADAAALAAADELFLRYPTYAGKDLTGTAAASAMSTAAANGYPNSGASSVTVNIPPASGPFKGLDGYAEVIIEYRQPRFFSRIWDSTDTPVRARAVARGRWASVTDGIIVLDLDDKGSLNAHGNGRIVVQNAPVIVNSNHPEAALIANGSNAYLEAPSFEVTGGYTTTGGAMIVGNVHTGQRPVPDPLRYLPPPDPSKLPAGGMTVVSLGSGYKRYTLTPGRFSGGLSFGSKDSVIMMPGVYYMDAGGFSFTGQSETSLTAEGVLIYNAPTSTSHKISITGRGTVKITPPTSGIYQGISIFQDRTKDVTMKVTGNGKFDIRGTVYAANSLVMIEGNGDVSVGSQYISRTLDVGGNGDLNITYNPQGAPKTRILTLVE